MLTFFPLFTSPLNYYKHVCIRVVSNNITVLYPILCSGLNVWQLRYHLSDFHVLQPFLTSNTLCKYIIEWMYLCIVIQLESCEYFCKNLFKHCVMINGLKLSVQFCYYAKCSKLSEQWSGHLHFLSVKNQQLRLCIFCPYSHKNLTNQFLTKAMVQKYLNNKC